VNSLLTHFERNTVLRLPRRQREIFEHGRERGFLVYTHNDATAYRTYYQWCELTQRPIVRVRRKTRFATVRFDMMTV
jgi:hypothetical protein